MSSTRREFLKSLVGASTVVSLSAAAPEFLQRAAQSLDAAEPQGDTVLVLLQLSGGNDGLNTVVPYADDVYARSRQTLRLTDKDVHKIDEHLGFHPALARALPMLREGHLSVLQGVGYPNSNRSHDEALRDWHTARPADAACQTGWVGRAIDQAVQPDDTRVTGVCVAPIPRPLAMNAEKSVVPVTASADKFVLREPPLSTVAVAVGGGDADPLAAFVRQGFTNAYRSSQLVQEVLRQAGSGAEYPNFTLAQQLKTVAELARAGLGIRIYFTELGGGGIGGFDNHANQRDNHAALLREIAESLAAFARDLQRDRTWERILLVTFSEFGRTLRENGRRGTDHGAAAPVLLVGGKLAGGVIGRSPSLTDLDGDSPRSHTDFRSVYATVLDRWLQYDSEAILGQKFPHLDFLRS